MAFNSKKVLITGGAGALGLETAKRFTAEGAKVILLDKSEAQLAEAKKILPNALTVAVDLLDWNATREAVKGIGHVDHLINNAGVNKRQPFMEVTPDAIDLIFGVNYKAIVNVTQVVAGGMLSSGKGGTIVNISSYAGKVHLPDISTYCASKAAVVMMTKSMAVELGPSIRVNAICPTYMITPFTKDYIAQNKERFDALLQRAPIKRFLEVSEAVDSIIFLSSPASAMINGIALDVDGGYVAA